MNIPKKDVAEMMLENKSVKEIAAKFEVSLETIRNRIAEWDFWLPNSKHENRSTRKRRHGYYQDLIWIDAWAIYGKKCQACGEKRSVLIQWHHKVSQKQTTGKRESLSTLLNRIRKAGKPIQGIEMLCRNCHCLADIRDGTVPLGRRLVRIAEELGQAHS